MTVTEFVTLDPDELDGISDAELLEGYLYSVSGLYGGASLFRAPARPLPGAMPTVYADIVPMIQKIAEGNASLTSTKFQFSWTKSMADWGITSNPTTQEAIDAAANEILNKNFSAAQVSALIQRLLSTMPYELYWFDKSKGGYSMVCNGSGGKDNFAVNLTISMAISAEYATSATENVTINGVQTACHYVPDTTKTGAAMNAVAVAEGVVSKNATKSDYDKLVAYLEYIKNAVSYNTAAANSLKPGEAPHPNDSPWQLIDVFHGTGTPNHKQVVCEGYAKAFQYLCDLTGSFKTNKIECALVTGKMDGGTGAGDHMWNVVSIGSANYLVDVTNCDEGSVGAPDKLFLCGVTENEASKNYTAVIDTSNSVTYEYDKDTLDNYEEAGLKLSASAYTPPAVLTGSVTINGDAKIGVKLTVDTSGITSTAPGTLSYKWYRDGDTTPISGVTGNTYTPNDAADVGKKIKVEVTAANYSGSVTGITNKEVAKGAGSAAPIAAPTLESRTADSIRVSHSLTDLEFACVEASASLSGASWQENMTFNNLEANTEYEIYARSKATDTHEAGDLSPALTVTTKKETVNETIKKGLEESITPYKGTYDGNNHPAVTVSSGLVPGTGWVVKYGESTGSYIGSVPMVTNVSDNRERYVWFEHDNYEPVGIPYTVNISPKSITPTVTLSNDSFTYDGTAKTPTVTVTDDKTELKPDTDYTVQYANNTDAGTAKVTVTEVEKGNYTWSPAADKSFTIANATITTDGAFKNYSGDYDDTPHGILVDTSKIITVNGQSPEIKYSSDGSSYTLDASPTITNASGSPMTVYWQVTAPNHEPAKGSATITINKIKYTGTTIFAETVRSGQVTTNKTMPLPPLPDGASYGTPSSSDALIAVGTMSIDSNTNTLTYSTTSQADNTSATITIPVTGATNYNNYEVTVTITATALPPAVVSTAPTAKSLTYNGGEQALVDAGTATGGEMRYKLGNDPNTSWSDNIPQATNAGDYIVSYIVKGDNQHSNSKEGSVTVNIAKRPVTIIGVTAEDKVYDGNNTAIVTQPTKIDGLLAADNVTVNPGTAAFADKNVGTGKTVTFSGYTLMGNGGVENNYALTQPASVTANITAKEVTITGVTAPPREYDKTNLDVSVGGSVTVNGAISGDNVTVNMVNAKGTMADANVGTDKSVTVTGCALDGADAGNYKLKEQPTGVTVNITPATYMGTTTASGSAKYGTSGTVDLSGLIVAGGTAACTSHTDANNVLNGTPAMAADGKTLNFAFKDDAANAAKTATVKVTVTSTNYKDYTITVTLKVTEKLAQTQLKYTGLSTVTYGQTLQLTFTGGSGTGKVTYLTTDFGGKADVDENGLLTATRTGKVTIKATKAGDDTHEESSVLFEITVTKAPLTVKVLDKVIYVGGAAPDLKDPKKGTDYTVTGLVKDGDLKGNAVMKYQQNGSEVNPDTSRPGVYDITLTGLTTASTHTGGTHDDYDLKIVPGKLTIKDKTVTPPSGGGGSSFGGGSSSSDRDTSDSGTVKTETTKNDDGSTTRTETKRDGTVIETTTGKDGSVSKTTTNPNGSSVTENKAADGSTGTVKTDKNGQTEAETKLSSKAIETAKRNGEPVKAPVEVEAARNSDSAPTVKIELPKSAGDTKVEIPVTNVKPGTVAVLVHPDGTEEIIKDSIPTENGVQLTVSGGATVKILDNSKDFGDIQSHWAKDAIDFVSARGLVNGINPTLYSPNASATRAQLWTILARQADTELNGGANWYEKAQNWAKDKGISDGADPNGTINRAQMVTMLWRAMGEPVAEITHSFTDIAADNYYAQAVAWAVRNGITTGVGDGRFDPNGACTRGQIAAFLMRYCSAK